MPLIKGDKLNPNGRPKGSKNKSTSEIREAFQQLVSSNLEQLQSDLDSLKPGERINYIIQMANYILPKMQTMSLEDAISVEYRELTKLLQTATPEAIEQVTSKLLSIKSIEHEKI